jgi:hypothetical protein
VIAGPDPEDEDPEEGELPLLVLAEELDTARKPLDDESAALLLLLLLLPPPPPGATGLLPLPYPTTATAWSSPSYELLHPVTAYTPPPYNWKEKREASIATEMVGYKKEPWVKASSSPWVKFM